MALYLVKSGFARWSIVIGGVIAAFLFFLAMVVAICEAEIGTALFLAFAGLANSYYARTGLKAVDIAVKADKVILTGLFGFAKEYKRSSVARIEKIILVPPLCRIIFDNQDTYVFLADPIKFMLKADYTDKLSSKIKQSY